MTLSLRKNTRQLLGRETFEDSERSDSSRVIKVHRFSTSNNSTVRQAAKGKIGSLRVRERYISTLECPLHGKGPQLGNTAYLLVPTASALDIYLKVFEKLVDAERNISILLLGSVLERLAQEGKIQTYEKCTALVDSKNPQYRQNCLFFGNQFFRDSNTHQLTPTVIDTLLWLRLHLEHNKYDLVLAVLTENPTFLELATSKHFKAFSTLDFLSHRIVTSPSIVELAESIALNAQRIESNEAHNFPEYWSQRRIEEEVNAGRAVSGILDISFGGSKDQSCRIRRESSLSDFHTTIGQMNRAINGDKVVVCNNQVVAVLQRNWRPYVVSLSTEDKERFQREGQERGDRQVSAICIPLDSRIPKIRITTRQPSLLIGQRFVVVLDDWPQDSRYPLGHYVRSLGPIGDVATESTTILAETGLEEHLNDFSTQALACLPPDGSSWRVVDSKGRRDFRKGGEDLLIFSVDPPGCQDIDDAMSFRVLNDEDNVVEVGVHIADVTHFVVEGTALDNEASRRATSVYLQDRRLDMLPRLLCEDLCSLRPNIDRFAVSVIWTIKLATDGATYSVQNVWIGRTVIQSAHALSYSQAQMLLDGCDPGQESSLAYMEAHTGKPVRKEMHEPLRKALHGLDSFARIREAERTRNGALALESEEFKFSLDATHKPNGVLSKAVLPIHGTVAELMIMANEQVAREIVQKHPQAAVVRRHGSPPTKKLVQVLELAEQAGIVLDTSSNHALAASMAQARSFLDPAVFSVVNDALTRAMSEAEYVCAGLVADFSHFGLGLKFYTHFTSPIRRYADVLVHRQVLLEIISSIVPTETPVTGPSSRNSTLAIGVPDSEWSTAVQASGQNDDLLFGSILGNAKEFDSSVDIFASTNEEDLFSQLEDPLKLLENTETNFQNSGLDCTLLNSTEEKMATSELIFKQEMSKTGSVQKQLLSHINTLHRAAKEASFRSAELFFSLYFQRNPQIVRGVVVAIKSFGIQCYIPKFQTKLLIHLDESHIDTGKVEGHGTVTTRNGHPVVIHMAALGQSEIHTATGTKVNEFSSASLSAEDLPLTIIKRLDTLPVYIHCPDTWDSHIPKPKLAWLAPIQGQDDFDVRYWRELKEEPSNAVRVFAKQNTPMNGGVKKSTQKEKVAHISFSAYQTLVGGSVTVFDSGTVSRRTFPSKEAEKVIVKPLCRGRVEYGGYVRPQHSNSFQCWSENSEIDESDISEPTGNSFSAIANDRREVEKYVAKVSKEATRRMERLLVAKRETKIKNRLKGSK